MYNFLMKTMLKLKTKKITLNGKYFWHSMKMSLQYDTEDFLWDKQHVFIGKT